MKFFPEPPAIASLLSSLIGRDVLVTPSSVPAGGNGSYRVWYLDDDGAPAFCADADIALSHLGGAAIAMIPKPRAVDAVRSGQVDADLVVHFREVLNLLARTINDAGGVHVHMDTDPTAPARDVPLASSASYSVDIDGYGRGVLTFSSGA